jgi:pyruvate dehydrogenase E2 component (dihydrolipoamide acetyltransferase)
MGNFKDVAIIDVLVKPGEKIEPEAPLVTLETEKATMDVPSTVGGVVEKIHIAKGGTVSTGDLIVTVRSEGAAAVPSAGELSAADTPAQTEASGASSGTHVGQAGGGAAPAGASKGSTAPGGSPGGAVGGHPGAAAGSTAAGQGGGGASSHPSGGGSGSAGGQAAAAPSAQARGQGTASGQGPSSGSGSAQGSAASGSGSTPGSGSASGQATAPGQARAAAGNGAGPAQAAAGRSDLPPINEPGFARAHAGPSVRRFAGELGVDLTHVTGGGFKGRVTHDDVKAFVKKFLAAGAKPAPAAAKSAPGAGTPSSWPTVPAIDFSVFGPIETKPLSRIQKISGPRLHASWVNIPHVTQFDEADITELEDLRTQLKQKALQAGIKLTPLAFIVRACVRALQEFPLFNSSLDPSGASLVLKKYIHVGFAADTPNGLVVPVVHDANRKDIYEIARQLGELSEKARAGKLSAAEMQGGSFTISSLGGIGGTAFTPIINAPEVAILGVSRSAMKPVFRDGTFVPRLTLPLSLSYDHRVIDGASAARFTTFLAQTLADPRALTEAVP